MKLSELSNAHPELFVEIVAIMIFARAILLPTIAAALLLILGASTSREAEAGVDARFEIFGFAGFHILTTRTTIEETPDRYAIAADLDTRGLASVFADITSHSEVHGVLSGDVPHPSDYRADMRRNGTARHYGLDYRGDGAVTNVSAPPLTGAPLFFAEKQIRGTVDQLTAYFIVERQLAQRGTCTLAVPVFDGSALYNLRFTDIEREMLSADGRQNFAGLSQVCQIVREDLVVNSDRNEDTYRRGRIWYARLIAGDRMMPVRMEFETGSAAVTGYLAEFRGRGVDLHLMKE